MCKTRTIYANFKVKFSRSSHLRETREYRHSHIPDWLGAAWRHFEGPVVTDLAPGTETLGKESELITMGTELPLCQPSSRSVSAISTESRFPSRSGQVTHPITRTQSSLTQLRAIWNSVSCQWKRLLRHLINHKAALIQNQVEVRMKYNSWHRKGKRELRVGWVSQWKMVT